MIRKIGNVRKSRMSRDEIIADLIFFLIPAFIVLVAIFFFDIHQSFYQPPYYPFNYLLNDAWVYVGGVLLGGLAGFFLIKLLLFGIREEDGSEPGRGFRRKR